MSILDELAAHARQRVQADAAQIPLDVLRERAARDGAADGAAFTAALRKPGLSFLCEVKRASPSKGMIAEEFPYVEIAQEYEGKVKVGKVNVDDEPALAGRFGISSIPTLILFKNGQQAAVSVGVRPKEELVQMLQ